jgi:hypothetical protein
MISGGLLLGSDPKSKICTTSSHTRCSCSALDYLDVLEQLGRSCIVVSRLVLFLSEDEERLGSWYTPHSSLQIHGRWGNFPVMKNSKGFATPWECRQSLGNWFCFRGKKSNPLNILKPKKSFFLKGKKRVTIICILWYTSVTSVGPLSTFEHISLLLVLGAFLWFSYQPSIRSKTDFRLVWGRYIPMLGGSHFCENHQFWFLGLFWRTCQVLQFKRNKISSLGNLSGFQIFEKIKCSQVSVEPVLIIFWIDGFQRWFSQPSYQKQILVSVFNFFHKKNFT